MFLDKIFNKLFKRGKKEDAEIDITSSEAAEAEAQTGEEDSSGADPLMGGELTEDAPPDDVSIIPESNSEEDDIDRQLNMMLKQDQEADADFEPQKMNGLVTSKSVFDGGSFATTSMDDITETQWESYEKLKDTAAPLMNAGLAKPRNIKERVTRMSVPRLSITAAVIAAVIVGIGLCAALIARNMVEAQAAKDSIAHFTPITQPVDVTNDGNFIFVGETVTLGGKQFTLSRLSVGSAATMVYFNNSIDTERYSFRLTDQAQNLYMRRQYSFVSAGGASVLEFEPLKSNVVFLTLTVHDNETGGESSFYFRFTGIPGVVPPSYINTPLPLIADERSAVDFNIARAVVSNTATEVFYGFNFEGSGTPRFGDSEGNPTIQLRQGIHLIPLMGKPPAELRFDGQETTIGKVTFAPIPFLNRKAELLFKDVNYSYDLSGREVDVTGLFNYAKNGPQTIYTGRHNLVLEAMAMQGTMLVMVLHGEDDEGGRIKTEITSTFSTEIDGETVEIEGVCYSADEGGDVVFDLSDIYGDLLGVSLSEYNVSIDTVEYNIPLLAVDLDLTAMEEAPERWLGEAQTFIADSFLTRLSYKSQLTAQADITGFSPGILNDRTLMRYYQPAGVIEMPKYNARVVSGIMTGENTFIGVAEDEWTLGEGVDFAQLHLTHKVVCERVNGRWTITEDTII